MRTSEDFPFTIEELLPHRPPILLVGEILEVDAVHAVTLSRVAPTWPMVNGQRVPPLICVELAAQTAGVCNGWERIRIRGADSDRTGWLVGIKRAEFLVDHLPVGAIIRTRAENTLVFDKFRESSSQLHIEDRIIAEVVLQLYQA